MSEPSPAGLWADPPVCCRFLGLFGPRAAYVKQALCDKLVDHKRYIGQHGEDMPEIRAWKWKGKKQP